MDFEVPKFISNLVENQFPSFYKEDGENFILFMKAYYEWMEDNWGEGNISDGSGGPIREARELLDYRDIDNTIENFLEYFQKKYLYGIPFSVIANKRFLLKHILDVYRSKGTIQCYKLLFKLLYNEDVEIYIPGRDILRTSDGIWNEPRYLEVSANQNLSGYIGKTIIGVTSRITATVEQYVKENYNNDVVNIIYISNIVPGNKQFEVGEKVVLLEDVADTDKINAAPSVLGSLDSITVVNGGQDYNLGDVIKIAHRDVSNNDVISYGIDGVLKVTGLGVGFGSLNFDIVDGGFGYTANASTFVYANEERDPGEANASFSVGSLTSSQVIQYNTDLVCNYSNLQLNETSYGFPGDESANLTSAVGDTFSYSNNTFGTIFTLDNIATGNGYEFSTNVFVRSTQLSDPLTMSTTNGVFYTTTSNTVTGNGTIFTSIFANDDVIALQSNSSLNSTIELQVIKEVVNATSITLYGPPTLNSTASAQYMAAPTILPSNFAFYEEEVFQEDGSLTGENENVVARPNIGNNTVSTAVAINSGKGYKLGEEVIAYLSGAVSNNISIIESGINYQNNEVIVFSGGNPGVIANGYIMTDSNGSVTSAVVTYGGSGYDEVPVIRIRTANGTGANLRAEIQEFNTTSQIIARVNKSGIGKGRGYWTTTRGFVSADKYIQDSEYYQDYSYEIRVARTLNKYKDIINDTFHVAGSALFGKYLKYLSEASSANLVYEEALIYDDAWGADSANTIVFRVSTGAFTADSNTITADQTERDFTGYLSADSTSVTADNRKLVNYVYASQTGFRADDGRITVDRYFV